MLSLNAFVRITRAGTSGCAALASASNGKVTHNGNPALCPSWQSTSNPPREALIVSHRSIR